MGATRRASATAALRAGAFTFALALGGPSLAGSEGAAMVFVAASAGTAVEEIGDLFRRGGHGAIRISAASSSTLAKQIAQGAPADAYLSANRDWMDYLVDRGRIEAASRIDLLSNTLVLIAPGDSPLALTIEAGFPLAAALGGGRLVIGDPSHVPAGRYAREALESLGVWEAVAPRVVGTQDVRAALLLIARGEAPAGIVYATDALIEPRVRIVAEFPPDSHTPISYPFALVTGPSGSLAGRFAQFLRSAQAAEVFRRHGFTLAASPPSGS